MERKLKHGSIVVFILTGISIGWMGYNMYDQVLTPEITVSVGLISTVGMPGV